jgi:hypothetical protein
MLDTKMSDTKMSDTKMSDTKMSDTKMSDTNYMNDPNFSCVLGLKERFLPGARSLEEIEISETC